MRFYLDTSTLLRVIFGEAKPLGEWGKWSEAYSSELARVEARRAIERLRLAGAAKDAQVVEFQSKLATFERYVKLVDISRPVLHRAGLPMGTPVKTLDAIHLASALLLQEQHAPDLVFATHDKRQAQAAGALGLPTVGV